MNPVIKRYDINVSEALLSSNVHPLLQKVYANRKIKHPDELNYQLNQLLGFNDLKGLDEAVAVIAEIIF